MPRKPRPFTLTECSVILGLYRTQPVKGCHAGRGWRHSEKCFDTCHSSWFDTVRDVALLLSFARPELEKELFVAACKQLPLDVRERVNIFWDKPRKRKSQGGR